MISKIYNKVAVECKTKAFTFHLSPFCLKAFALSAFTMLTACQEHDELSPQEITLTRPVIKLGGMEASATRAEGGSRTYTFKKYHKIANH